MTVDTLLLVAAFVCFVIAAFGYNPPRGNLIAAGLALVVLSMLI